MYPALFLDGQTWQASYPIIRVVMFMSTQAPQYLSLRNKHNTSFALSSSPVDARVLGLVRVSVRDC